MPQVKINPEHRRLAQEFKLNHLRKNPCGRCGFSDATLLEFSYRNTAEKAHKISSLVYGGCVNLLQQEIAKCEVLCPTCRVKKTKAKRALKIIQITPLTV